MPHLLSPLFSPMAPLTPDRPQQVWPSTKQETAKMANQQTTNRKPTHDVCHVRGDGNNTFWTTIGAGWQHEDGKGLSISLDFMPTDTARLVIRLRKDKGADDAQPVAPAAPVQDAQPQAA